MTDRGWARALGVPESTPIDQALITRILDYLEARVRAEWDPTPGIFNPPYEQRIRDWRAATENALRKYMGAPVGQLPPNPLEWDPSVRQPELGDIGSVVGAAVDQALAGAADIVGKGLILVVVGGLVLMGAWLMFREPSVVIQQLRKAPGRVLGGAGL